MKKQSTLVTTRRPVALATCPRCHRRVRLTVQGRLWAHCTDLSTASASCPGGYRKVAT
jgi:hypothetical protein